jgi:hypothetical protein
MKLLPVLEKVFRLCKRTVGKRVGVWTQIASVVTSGYLQVGSRTPFGYTRGWSIRQGWLRLASKWLRSTGLQVANPRSVGVRVFAFGVVIPFKSTYLLHLSSSLFVAIKASHFEVHDAQ